MAGRPKGRSDIAPKVRAAIIRAIDNLGTKKGKGLDQILAEQLEKDPISTLNMISKYCPKEIEMAVTKTVAQDMTDEELDEAIAIARKEEKTTSKENVH